MMNTKSLALFVTLIICAFTAVTKDLVTQVPGYPTPFTQKVYSGYLNTADDSRKLHYVFVESSSLAPADNIPLTLWLNGGPGCSSLLGFLQEIGPYYLDEGSNYTVGQKLIQNPYSWNKLSHLLFIESPAGVGYSINNDPKFEYSDATTATDNLNALLSFFAGFPQYLKNALWIAGQSYAGKYIPDLALKIDANNNKQGIYINLKGIMVGNGVMNYQNGELQKSQVDFMIDHEFVDVDILPYYRGSCFIDPASAGCRYFNNRYRVNIDEINPYNVYSYCYYNDSFLTGDYSSPKKQLLDQASIIKNIARNKGVFNVEQTTANGATCAYFDGVLNYFKAHAKEYHAADGIVWNGPCADNITAKYSITLAGSMKEYRTLLTKLDTYRIVLYSGDWDDVVPYTDTLKNLAQLNLKESNIQLFSTPFFANDQHAGWTQIYDGILFAIIKGASHQVPQSKRAEAFELFKTVLQSSNAEEVSKTE